MKNLNKKFQTLRRKDKTKNFSPRLEPPNLKNFKKRKPHKNSRPKRWSKSSLLLKLFKKLKLLPPRKQLQKLILPD